MDTDVLVVGAGPTGLMLANWLAKLGIGAIIADAKSGTTRESRALGLQARSIEIYAQLGLADEVLAQAREAPAARFGLGPRMFHRVPFAALGEGLTPYPRVYMLEQSRNEQILDDNLRLLGREVLWEHAFQSVTETGDGVEARLDHGGETVSVTARYLVGADGASSAVREARGIRFTGTTNPQTFCVIDADGVTGIDEEAINIRPATTDFLLTFPMSGAGHARVITVVPSAVSDGADPETAVAERVAAQFGVHWRSASWFAAYRVHHRVAERFRDGRVFLAGDAAHVHSPVGAQGMNTGLQDAHNLAFAFADVLRRGADDDTLDRYERERRPVALTLVATADRLFSFVTSDRMLPALARRIVPRVLGGPVTSLVPRLGRARRLFGYLSQIRVRYRMPGSEHDGQRDSVVGRRLPWAGENFQALRSCEWQVHEYGSVASAAVDALERSLGLTVHRFPAAPGTPLVPGEFYLVRPDGYVAGRARASEAAARFAALVPGGRQPVNAQ
ncbi:2-polyprenyl-6-methoxyphenol hydroxylase [Paramicrobacterium humi]|uniref:2-polyprenyl-6-methoxyphenol hydroxylase n=1 Tax=Paramicrobacterium humi TaxID=640635 RepID=A0A1H4JKG5_9MICO|nr:FAD-dependent monooxygenase [Microbacterium humi]SEB46657.1 2-polyprenyl-6-methoxyphenol hydroxylase [Microbacterium humi]